MTSSDAMRYNKDENMKNDKRSNLNNEKKPGQAGFRTPANFRVSRSMNTTKGFNQKHRIPRSK
ncbi:MAG: hypothetical protein WDZ85_00815 [Candidatus Paceibacterota bacterium]